MVDYSKWKDIEISDDEDETHPNIDTPSLFRWRHQARVERMEERKKEREEFEESKKNYEQRYKETADKIKSLEGNEDVSELKEKLKELEVEGEKIKEQDKELSQKEKVTPWNVDTISQPGFTKTVVNNPPKKKKEELSEEEKERRFKEFVKENEPVIKKFGMMRKYNDSKQFLLEHPQLAREETANYLVVWCINLEIDEKHNLVEHVAHQTICMQYILEISKELDVDPRACISSFFTKIQLAEREYKAQFDEELKSLKDRIKRRAQDKLDEAMKEVEEEERKSRIGPGGLDPVEVFEELPEELKKCFESKDVGLLKATIATLPTDQVKYHMKRCVDSGLWIPESNQDFLKALDIPASADPNAEYETLD